MIKKYMVHLLISSMCLSSLNSYATSTNEQKKPASKKTAQKSSGYKTGVLYHIDSEEEYNDVIKNENVVIDFYAEWCGPCKRLSPIFSELVKEFKNITFVKVDTDKASSLTSKMGIKGLPTIVFYKNGKKVHQISGQQSKDTYRKLFKEKFEL